MRIRTVATVVACTLTVVAVGTIVANAGADITSPETISAVGTQTKARYIDNGKPGFGPGDVNMFTERLTDDSDAVIGSARVTCTVQIGQWAMCDGAFTIDGRGEIVGSGIVNIGEDETGTVVPITGGTGDFANVRGEDQIEFVSETEEVHTLNLLP